MSRKITIFLLLILFSVNVFALEVDQFPENESQNVNSDIAKMKGDLTIKIKDQATQTRNEVLTKLQQQNNELKDYIDEKTNPLYLNLPTILLLFIIVLIWGILKGRGKI